MFENYENIPTSYIPNNMMPQRPAPSVAKSPMTVYNAKGDFVGYTWKYGDEIVLNFLISGNVIYDDSGDLENTFYETAEQYLEGKYLIFELFNFRYEVAWIGKQYASTNAKFYIDQNCSKHLLPGVYKGRLTLVESLDPKAKQKTHVLAEDDSYTFTIK